MADDPHASPDPLANKRYAYGKALEGEGDWIGAADLYEQAVERDPDWAAGWYALGLARLEAGLGETAAAEAFERSLVLNPADSYGAGLRLARLKGEAPDAPPVDYVRGLFDQYADRFEDVLVERLGYRAPALIASALDRAAPGRIYDRVMDLGCGTGLMAEALIGRFTAIDGIDLAPAMVEAARHKGLYAELAEGNVLADVAPRQAGRYDAVIAADVLCYIGELSPVFERARDLLRVGGLLAFSIEALDPLIEDATEHVDARAGALDGVDFALLPSLRYAHGFDGVVERAAAAGFALTDMSADVLRHDRGHPVIGYVMVFQLSNT